MGSSARFREEILRLICTRNEINVLIGLFRSMAIRSALRSLFLAAVFSGAALSVASVGIEDEDDAVCAGDLDRLAGFGALVEQVAVWLRIVVRDPFAAGREISNDEVRDEGEVDDVLMSLPLHPLGCLRQSMSAPLPFPEAVEAKEELDFAGADEADGQKCRDLQVKARSFSCPHSGQWKRVNPAARHRPLS